MISETPFLFQELKAAIPTNDPKFEDITKALKAAEDVVLEKDKEPDQDVLAHRSECDNVIIRWATVKKELDSTLEEIDSIIPQAEKGIIFNKYNLHKIYNIIILTHE